MLPDDGADTAAAGADASPDAGEGGEDTTLLGEAALPERYELTAPEGLELTPEVLDEVTPVFRDLGLTNEQAGKLMPLAKGLVDRVLQGQADGFAALRADWAKETKGDPEIGGRNWAETERLAGKALNALGAGRGSAFNRLLDETGLGNHPEMIRLLRKVGTLVSEDTNFPRADAGAAIKRSPEEILYPSMTQAKE